MKAVSKIILLVLAVVFLGGGWLGYSHYSFQIRFDDKISARDLAAAKNLLEDWEKTRAFWFLKNIPQAKQELAFEKGWLLSQFGAYEEAIKEFRKVGNNFHLGSFAVYNAATLGLVGGRESMERLAEEYIRALVVKPDDFQTKVNLEIIRILQNQAKKGMPQQGDGKEGKGKDKMKQFQMKEKEGQGTESNPDQGTRY